MALGAQAHAAGKPFVIDPRANTRDPAVAVDDAGLGHFVWLSSAQPARGDVNHYCGQVPRNKRACSKPKSHPLVPSEPTAFSPRVLLPGDGKVVVLAYHCCGRADGPYAVISDDNGASFKPPRQIGTVEPLGDAQVGPGAFSVSLVSDITTAGTFFQAAPLNEGPPASGAANVGDKGSKVPARTTAPSPSSTPSLRSPRCRISSTCSSGATRAATRSTTCRSGARCRPRAGADTRLAGLRDGKTGREPLQGQPQPQHQPVRRPPLQRHHLRRADQCERGGATPIFADFFQDAGGLCTRSGRTTATTVWCHQESPRTAKNWQSTGGLWATAARAGRRGTCFTSTALAPPRTPAGSHLGQDRSAGPIRAVQFGPTTSAVGSGPGPGGGGGSCVGSLRPDQGESKGGGSPSAMAATATSTTGDIQVPNFLASTFTGTPGSGAAHAAATPTITIDKSARTIKTSGAVETWRGPWSSEKDTAPSWKAPAAGGQVTDLAGNPTTSRQTAR